MRVGISKLDSIRDHDGMFLLVRSVGDVLGREEIRTLACSSKRMIIESYVNPGEAQSTP